MKQLFTYPLFSNIAIIVVLSSLIWSTSIAPLQCFIDGKISMELYDVLEGESEKEEQEKKEELKDKIPIDFLALENAYFNRCIKGLLSANLISLHHPDIPTPPPDGGVL